jgi:hypothetical protein
MTQETSTVTIHMVASLDGFIAKKDNNVNWFETASHYEQGVEPTEEAMTEFSRSVGCYVIGART